MTMPPRLALASLPTRLELLSRLSEEVGTRIWLKRDDLTDTIASGNKIRKLEFTIAEALAQQATVLVTCGGIQSNHCRATAALAARLGIKSHLILRGDEPSQTDGNLLLDRLFGASISFVTTPEYQDMPTIFKNLEQTYARAGEKAFMIPVGATDEIGLWGYIECAAELKKDFAAANITPEVIVSATGSGGTLGGLILGKEMYGLSSKIMAINVCDDANYFIKKINEDALNWKNRYQQSLDVSNLAINIIEGYVAPGYGRAHPAVFDTIRRVASLEGIVLDPVYTGKAFDGMLREIDSGVLQNLTDIVFLHTGGIYGLFPQREQLFNSNS